MAATGNTMWNGRYGEEESRRRQLYDRVDKLRRDISLQDRVERDPITKAQTGEDVYQRFLKR